MPKTLLEVQNLQTRFCSSKAVNGVSFRVEEREVLGIVGESGCGKSVTALSIMRLIEAPGEIRGGKVLFHDGNKQIDLLTLSDRQLEKIFGSQISMIFQDPMTSLNPVLSVGYQISETLRVHRGLLKKDAKMQAARLLQRVGVANANQRINDYPHQFSGGMRQRVMIAMALACNPELLIADEPTTALDVTIQAQILMLLRDLKREFGMSMIIITHDLGVVAQIADRVAVMYAGKIVENAAVEKIFSAPRHPYTQALIASIPRLYEQPERLKTIEGSPPRPSETHSGCSFYRRCAYRLEKCAVQSPVLNEISAGHSAACWLPQNGAAANV